MNSPIAYLGGKRLLLKHILPRIPVHHTYVEVFAGGAWVYFGKEPSPVEIINDRNSELVTLYRIWKHHPDEFLRCLKQLLVAAREEYQRFLKEDPETLTDINRAVRFYYLLRNSYGGQVARPSFTVSPSTPPKINLGTVGEHVTEAYRRLNRTYIENRDFERIITANDRPETFFYVDPPYNGCESDYGKGIFSVEDFTRLRNLLKGIKGKFLMSINDTPLIRELFQEFHVDVVPTTYHVSGKPKKVAELLIRNYDIAVPSLRGVKGQ